MKAQDQQEFLGVTLVSNVFSPRCGDVDMGRGITYEASGLQARLNICVL